MNPPSCSECIHYMMTVVAGRDRPGCMRSQTTYDLRTLRPPKGGFEIAYERASRNLELPWRYKDDICGPTGKHFKARTANEAQS